MQSLLLLQIFEYVPNVFRDLFYTLGVFQDKYLIQYIINKTYLLLYYNKLSHRPITLIYV